jgi:phosphoribosylamine---glycine ligase
MRVLVVGHGGREHALLDKLQRDDPAAELFITRGNGGTDALATPLPLDATDAPALAAWADASAIDLTIVGPEAALAAGIADLFLRRGLPIFGPTRAAAEIESSKAFAKALMKRAGVPTADFASFSELAPAQAYIRDRGAPIVVKASGLAAGKGAVVCENVEDALATARAMIEERSFGAAGSEIVVEEFLTGDELSIFALCSGDDALLMIPAQDHKRIGVGDTGPNTGGMGAYAPVSIADDALGKRVLDAIVKPTLAALRDDGRTFHGVLFCGIMLTAEGPKVIEFNARFGDPETQAILPLLATPLLDVALPIGRGGSLAGSRLDWHDAAAVTTVLAAAGYPGPVEKGHEIHVPDAVAADDALRIYHAGTRRDDAGRLVTDGGRVLAITALASTFEDAAHRSRSAAEAIRFEGRQYRSDIGWRELRRRAGQRGSRAPAAPDASAS